MQRDFETTSIDVARGEVTVTQEPVAVEATIALIINHQHRINLVASPSNLEDLAVGYLLSEGIISRTDQVTSIELREDQVLVDLEGGAGDADLWFEVRSSGCVGVKMQYEDLDIVIDSPLTVPAANLCAMQEQFREGFDVWSATGGTHVAGAFTPEGTLLYAAEDVGRHNAFDKMIGMVVRSGADPRNLIGATTGRLAAGLVAKAVRAGFPILISKAAPLDAGITLARRVGLTLCGFVRGMKINVYSHPHRILV